MITKDIFLSYVVVCLVGQSCLTLWNLMDCSPPGSSVHGDSPGKNTVEDCHALLQGIFPTQGSSPGLPTLQADSLLTEPQGKPKNRDPGLGLTLKYQFLTLLLRRKVMTNLSSVQLLSCVRLFATP